MRLVRSHRMEALFEALTEELSRRRDVLEPAWVLVQSRSIEHALELHAARTLGAIHNVRFERLGSLPRWALSERWGPPGAPRELGADAARWEGLLLAVLHDDGELAREDLSPVRSWLGTELDGMDLRRVSLAARVAELFTRYDRTRPELVRAWISGAAPSASLGLEGDPLRYHERWQRALFERARARGEARLYTELLDLAHDAAQAARPSERAKVHVLGLSQATKTSLHALALLAQRSELHVYALDPCREYWEDALSGREEARRRKKSPKSSAPDAASESPLLSAWGLPGRELLGQLNELAGWDADERFESAGDAPTALGEIQRSILERRPVAQQRAADGSVVLSGCPSVRRELEVVAGEIWARVAAGSRFHEIVVLMPEGEQARYLPLLPSVFAEARELPWSAVGAPFVWRSRIASAALALVGLLRGELTRSRVLDLLLHPSVRAQMPDARSSTWAAILDRLGFFAGLDVADEDGRGGDLAQALDRMAIGAVAMGERSGVTTPIGGWYAEEIEPSQDESGGLYRILRSLSSDLAYARAQRMELTEWAAFIGSMLGAYLVPESPGDEADLNRVRACLLALERRSVPGAHYGPRVAEAVFTRELLEAETELGSPGVYGVTVQTLAPMRAVPHRHVFVLGLGEGRFGAEPGERGLDLSRGARKHLDVEAAERDRYTFLETLLSARESVTLSWVARDEATGDALLRAPVLQELAAAAGGLLKELKPPLRRHEDVERGAVATAAIPLADLERRARALGELERHELGQEEHGPSLSISAFSALVRQGDPRRSLLTWDTPNADRPSASQDVETQTAAAPATEPSPGPRRLGPRPPPRAPRAGTPVASLLKAGGELRVPLRAIRDFLERPMQAAAERALGQAPFASRERIDEPPVELERRVHVRLLLDAARHALAHPEARARGFLEARAERERAHGGMPRGALGTRALSTLEVELDAILRQVREALGIRLERGVRGLRFGPGRAVTEHDELTLPIVSLGLGARGARVTLEGEAYGWVADEGRALLLLDPFARPHTKEKRARTRVRRSMLRALVDHAALAASSAPFAVSARNVHVISAEGEIRAELRPMEESAARTWLRGLADELELGHATFLPGEVILGEADRIRGGDPNVAEMLEKALERARSKDDRLGELFGPVRDPKDRPGPEPSELLRLVGRRFAPFFEYVREEAGLGSERLR